MNFERGPDLEPMLPQKIYRIIDGRNRSGLFSIATIVLENLVVATVNISYQVALDSRYLYFDPKWGPNVWDYYFRQPRSDRSFSEIVADPSTEWGFTFDRRLLLDGSNRGQSYIETVRQASSTFYSDVGFSDYMNQQITSLDTSTWQPNDEILGVHRRAV